MGRKINGRLPACSSTAKQINALRKSRAAGPTNWKASTSGPRVTAAQPWFMTSGMLDRVNRKVRPVPRDRRYDPDLRDPTSRRLLLPNRFPEGNSELLR